MRSRLAGVAALSTLICLGYSPIARADSFTPSTVAKASVTVPPRDTWDPSPFTGQFAAMLTDGQVSGTWDFGSVNPFLRDMAHSGDDVQVGFQAIGLEEARRFLTSPHAASNSAVLNFGVTQIGDRDGDTLGDYHLVLNSAAFTGSSLAQFGSNAQAIPTPEPASLLLLGSGLAGLGFFGLRRRRERVR